MRCRLLDVNQVAELLGCSTAHVYDYVGAVTSQERDRHNALRFNCRNIGRVMAERVRVRAAPRGGPR